MRRCHPSPPNKRRPALGNVLGLLVFYTLLACGSPKDEPSMVLTEPDLKAEQALAPASGTSRIVPQPNDTMPKIAIDGSSTVFPITEAAVRAYGEVQPDVLIQLGVSGTGGGFKKFCRGQTLISNASRPIKASEAAVCAEHGVDFIEIPIAFDGVSLVVHPQNPWAQCLSVDELRKIWHPNAEGVILSWRQVRPDWPEQPLELYAPGHDSGTFDYFTSAVVGEEGISRNDFTGSEDDYLLAQDIAARPNALGFFGHAYYSEYRERLRLVAIDSGSGCVQPSERSIETGEYHPLSRPIFLYVATEPLARPEVEAFLTFYIDQATDLVRQVQYVPLPDWAYRAASRRLRTRHRGSVFQGGSQVGVSLRDLFPEDTPP